MPAGDGKRYDRFKNMKQVLSLSNTAEVYQKCSRDSSRLAGPGVFLFIVNDINNFTLN